MSLSDVRLILFDKWLVWLGSVCKVFLLSVRGNTPERWHLGGLETGR